MATTTPEKEKPTSIPIPPAASTPHLRSVTRIASPSSPPPLRQANPHSRETPTFLQAAITSLPEPIPPPRVHLHLTGATPPCAASPELATTPAHLSLFSSTPSQAGAVAFKRPSPPPPPIRPATAYGSASSSTLPPPQIRRPLHCAGVDHLHLSTDPPQPDHGLRPPHRPTAPFLLPLRCATDRSRSGNALLPHPQAPCASARRSELAIDSSFVVLIVVVSSLFRSTRSSS